MNKDLAFIEGYVKRLPIQGLSEYFVELRQIIDLILSDDPMAYMDLNARAKLYPALGNPKRLLGILEKFKETVALCTLFTLGRKACQLFTLIKKLKES